MRLAVPAEPTNRTRFAPDLLADRDIRRVDRLFLLVVSLSAPPLLGGLLTWSWRGALTAFFWAGLVRIALLHHVTWSINSICHVYGERPFAPRGDRAANFWPLAILSFGETWHNFHHADPTVRPPRRPSRSARHVRPAHLALREGRVGLRRALAHPATAGPPRRPASDVDPGDAGDPAGAAGSTPAGGPTAGGGSIDR